MEKSNEEKAKELVQKTKSEVPSKSAVYAAVMDALEWKEKQMIQKIVKYLESHALPSENGYYFSVSDIGIDKLKQAMNEN